jgi:hypothetical protein
MQRNRMFARERCVVVRLWEKSLSIWKVMTRRMRGLLTETSLTSLTAII